MCYIFLVSSSQTDFVFLKDSASLSVLMISLGPSLSECLERGGAAEPMFWTCLVTGDLPSWIWWGEGPFSPSFCRQLSAVTFCRRASLLRFLNLSLSYHIHVLQHLVLLRLAVA